MVIVKHRVGTYEIKEHNFDSDEKAIERLVDNLDKWEQHTHMHRYSALTFDIGSPQWMKLEELNPETLHLKDPMEIES